MSADTFRHIVQCRERLIRLLFNSKQEYFWRLNWLFGQWVDSNIRLLHHVVQYYSCALVQYMFVIMIFFFFSLVYQVCQVSSLPCKLFISMYCSSASIKPARVSVALREFCDLPLLINPVS